MLTSNEKSNYNTDDKNDENFEEVLRLPVLKRTDSNVKLVQTYFTEEEKELFTRACDSRAMAHVLRCLALEYARKKIKENG